MASLLQLPVELLESILAQLAVPDLAVARNVCQSWRELCDFSTAIPSARRKIIELRGISRADRTTAIVAKKLRPFVQHEVDREEYLSRVGSDVPEEFKIWALETPYTEMPGWHSFALLGDHDRHNLERLGIDWTDAMVFSRAMKPGLTLLPHATVMLVEDPDYSNHNNTDHTYYPGSWQCQRPAKEQNVRALQVWADLSTSSPKITLLLLSGSDRWDGQVWETETYAPYRHSVDSLNRETQLVWLRPMGSWTDYLKSECRLLQENHRALPSLKTYRSGGRVWLRQVH
ncbi:hypothetical protein FKW77_008529 [Venturia effusa]|uniref:F-box domain-containing protein n=1 Tax=Venturia effusa TaxID=50376 RepID=A0A517LBF4_9PEZI|nr:hypothetical protein FKW77_008529 [Venturia effusa]